MKKKLLTLEMVLMLISTMLVITIPITSGVDPAPEPWLIEPSTEDDNAPRHGELLMVYGHNITLSAIELLYADDIEFATFMYSVDGGNWSFIGKDFNSSKEAEGLVDIYGVPYEGFDVWSVSWNTSGLAEGLYYIRVLMMDSAMQFGTHDIQVYFEQIPPIPVIYEPFWSEEVNGVIEVMARTNASDIEYVVFENLQIPWFKEYAVPIVGLRDAVCVPNAKAALIFYWASLKNSTGGRPFRKLIMDDGKEFTRGEMLELIRKMLEVYNAKHHTNKQPTDGFTPRENMDLVGEWVKNKTLLEKLKLVGEIRRYEEGEAIGIKDLKTELQKGPVKIGIYRRKNATSFYGHAMILTSIKNTPVSKLGDPDDWLYEVDLMDSYKAQLGKIEYRKTTMTAKGFIRMDWDEDGEPDSNPPDGQWIIGDKEQILPIDEKMLKELGVCSTSGNWTLAGIDYNGTDGWNLPFNTTQVADGFHFIRATMVDSAGNNASDIVEVFINNYPELRVEPMISGVRKRGEDFNLNVTVSDLEAQHKAIAVQFRLYFNKTMIQLLNVTEGPFMSTFAGPPNGGTFSAWYEEPDHVRFMVMILPDENNVWHEPFPNGNGTIATLAFKATLQNKGMNDPPLLNALTLLNTSIFDIYSLNVPHGIQSGLYEIFPTNIGDINYDGKVDIMDIATIAVAFGSYPGHPRWNPEADITGPTPSVPDNRIDIRDIATAAKNFGWTQSP